MIIPDNLRPLPVADDEAKASPAAGEQDFVHERDVRCLLVGPLSVPNPKPRRFPADDFAGRDDCDAGDTRAASPFVALAPDDEPWEPEPDRSLPKGPHPALDSPRKPSPPKPRIDVEQDFGGRAVGDRWWVLGVGIALLALLCSGSLVQIVSHEAVKRAGLTAPIVNEAPPVEFPDPERPSLVSAEGAGGIR